MDDGHTREEKMDEKPEKTISSRASGESAKQWSEEEERAVRRKMDVRLLPLLTSLYLVCFIDRANIGNARIQGLQTDLHLVGYRFNWALTVFYIPYLLVEIPSNILLKGIGNDLLELPLWWNNADHIQGQSSTVPTLLLPFLLAVSPLTYGGLPKVPFLVFSFGVVSVGTAFVQGFKGLCVARAFLGLAEGGTMPGIAYFLSCFYKRDELLFRVGIFVSASSLAGAFGGLLATALSRIPTWGVGAAVLHTWRNIFFFEGLITIAFAILGCFLMPRSPESCSFLNERERWVAAERVRIEHKELGKEKTELWHVKRAVFNINNILCALGFFFINVTVQSFSLFLPTILKALGWQATKAQLYTVPPYVCACAFSILIAYLSDRHRRRGLYILSCTTLVITGYSILVNVESANAKYAAVFLAAAGAFPLGPAFLSWGINNAAGTSIRAVTGGYLVSVGTTGAILATWTYLPTDAPRYKRGHSINLATATCAAVISIIGVLYIRWENRIRRRGGRDARLEGLTEEEAGKLGYRHPAFRYIE